MNTTTDTRDKGYWLETVRRYFEAETTVDEERALARFLSTDGADAPEFDEARAVMGYFAAGRRSRRAGGGDARSDRRSAGTGQGGKAPFRLARRRMRGAVAACALAACMAGAVFTAVRHRGALPVEEDVCVAYINGELYTAPDVVMAEMRRTMRDVQGDDVSSAVERQLTDMFLTAGE